MEKLPTLRAGDASPATDLLQTALSRSGFRTAVDGIFGSKTLSAVRGFQATRGLVQDGVVGYNTWKSLSPYLAGFMLREVAPGDTYYKLAAEYGTKPRAIETANPGIDPERLTVGTELVIPLPFDVTPVNIRWSAAALAICAEGIGARYPFVAWRTYGRSVTGHELLCAEIGAGYGHEVFYNASHHANEWITTPVLVKFLEDYAKAVSAGGEMYGIDAQSLFGKSRLTVAPLVNPDGVELVTGALRSGAYYDKARAIAAEFPGIPFPDGWKANIEGVDPNLQYPANWNRAREIKFAQGFTKPAPRDFVGDAPLTAPESRAVRDLTLAHDFKLTLSYHTQGEVIYWKYLDMEPPLSRELAELFGRISGYTPELTPPDSSFAGYKDWFIEMYDRPGFTIECGLGAPPLQPDKFGKIYLENFGVLATALTANIL
ncbi:MAG: peptidoglycan-binding protein [Oscillospiraceae bacterium]|jgi:g-D-glutamyl-meso-diaminopimelate peptidase|nr:peptidoglycan-binding protein [Oscillospiraceae bacterium]